MDVAVLALAGTATALATGTGAVLVHGLLPFSFAFAAGAMLSLVAAGLMEVLALTLGVD
jgi:hypothetical protein